VDRPDLMAMMAELSLSGMRAAYDEVIRDGVKRQRPVQQILGDLLAAEVAEKKARSIRYQGHSVSGILQGFLVRNFIPA
jgi:hypothetical protein